MRESSDKVGWTDKVRREAIKWLADACTSDERFLKELSSIANTSIANRTAQEEWFSERLDETTAVLNEILATVLPGCYVQFALVTEDRPAAFRYIPADTHIATIAALCDDEWR